MAIGVKARPQSTISAGVPAPIRGLVASGIFGGNIGSAAAEGATGVDSAIWLYNMIAGEYGCRVRPGSREFAVNIPDTDSNQGEVRTVMYYNSSVAGPINDFTFAVTDEGIYDISAGGVGPWDFTSPTSHEWANKGIRAGWCSCINYTNVGGDQFLLVCDEENGYWIFDGSTWAAGTFTGNPKPEAVNLVQIVEWNARIWMVERNTARVWFLDPLALTGDITPLDVGNRFKDGGHLVQCSTWSLDDGAGMDDKFIMISSSGDVLIWEGIDPTTAADLTLVGRWQVGTVPEGRRVMSDWGGNVAILSASGIVTADALLAGAASTGQDQYISRNINQYIRSAMDETIDDYGWSLGIVPKEGIAIITVPTPRRNQAPIQFVLELSTTAWSMFRDLKMVCNCKVNDKFYFGTYDGRVLSLEGSLDDVLVTDETTGKAITFSLLTHYDPAGSAAVWKRAQFIRPYWIGAALPSYVVQIRFDFDLEELPTNPAYVTALLSRWDLAIWDADPWEGTAQSYLQTRGVSGMGRHLAIAIRGSATNALTYIGADVMYDTGGML